MRLIETSLKFSLLFVAMTVLSACASAPSVIKLDTQLPEQIGTPSSGIEGLSNEMVVDTVRRINERNSVTEDDPEWIKKAYSGLMVRRLNNISPKDYRSFAKYLDNGAVYLFIHPAFFVFFHEFQNLSRNVENPYAEKRNVVEKFLSIEPKSEEFAVMQAQERRMRNFVEFKSTEEKLIIMVVPRNYTKYPGYVYKDGMDEYMRYLNEITNLSKSVLFIESKSPNRGYPTEDDSVLLMDFLAGINATTLYIGGGYIGRCLEDFYSALTLDYGNKNIYIVPELSDASPREMKNALAQELLLPDGTIDISVATRFISEDVYRVQEAKCQYKNLP